MKNLLWLTVEIGANSAEIQLSHQNKAKKMPIGAPGVGGRKFCRPAKISPAPICSSLRALYKYR